MYSNMSWRYYQTKWISLLFIILLRGCLTTVIVKQLGPTIVTTKYGKLRGSLVEFPKDAYLPLKPVEAYLGIPYAALRKNYLRFMPPTSPQQRWRGIHAASKVRSVCPQKILREKPLSEYLPRGTVEVLTRMATFTKDQNEDCLSLNLYVPSRGKFWEFVCAALLYSQPSLCHVIYVKLVILVVYICNLGPLLCLTLIC